MRGDSGTGAEPTTPDDYLLINTRTGARLTKRANVVRATWRHLMALLGERRLEEGEGTRFMATTPVEPGPLIGRAPVDVLFLDRDGVVLHAIHSLPRREGAREPEVHSVVELPAGSLARLDTSAGDVVEMYREHREGERETAS